jgi:hypothetical protein
MARQQTLHKPPQGREQTVFSVSSTVYGGLDTAGSRLYIRLLSEGHYRCPHCRRADTGEMNGRTAHPA